MMAEVHDAGLLSRKVTSDVTSDLIDAFNKLRELALTLDELDS